MSLHPSAVSRAIVRSPAFAVAALAVLWLVAPPLLHIGPRYLPSLPTVVRDGVSVWPDLLASLWRTLIETVIGFVAGAAFGVAAGVCFAYLRIIERAFFPIFVALQTVPIIAFGAIVVIWFGNTIIAKVVIAFYLTFFPVAVNTLHGIHDADGRRIQLLKSFGSSSWQIFWKFSFPSALPTIMTGLKVGISLSLAGAIVGEWFGDTVGLGVMLLQGLYFEQVPRIWMLIVVCGALGATLYGVLVAFERRFVWWRSD